MVHGKICIQQPCKWADDLNYRQILSSKMPRLILGWRGTKLQVDELGSINNCNTIAFALEHNTT
jgi:hypothetical protein